MWISGCTLLAGGRAHCRRDWTLGASPINQCWKLYHVIKGSGKVVFDTGEQKLVPGHIYFLNGHRLTRQVCEGSMVLNWLHFQVTSWRLRMRLDRLPPSVSLASQPGSWCAKSLEEIRDLFDQPPRAHQDLRGLRPNARPETHLRVLGVLLGLLGEALKKKPEGENPPTQLAPQLQTALDYMEHHYLDNPPLATLAKLAGWQTEYFHRRFRQALGMTPLSFMERRRLEEAVALLTESTLTIKEIAAQLCYSSSFYFTRVFTRHYNVNPTEFRKQAIREC
jgi:AraC-like DNA-binding protein